MLDVYMRIKKSEYRALHDKASELEKENARLRAEAARLAAERTSAAGNEKKGAK